MIQSVSRCRLLLPQTLVMPNWKPCVNADASPDSTQPPSGVHVTPSLPPLTSFQLDGTLRRMKFVGCAVRNEFDGAGTLIGARVATAVGFDRAWPLAICSAV